MVPQSSPKHVVLSCTTVCSTNCEASCCKALNFFMRSLYKLNVFIPAAEARVIVAAGRHFLQGHARLSVLCYNLGQPRYPILPKVHMLYHVVLRMDWECSRSCWVQNPMTQNCAMDEDFIGRFCALTRSVNPRTRVLRSYERYFTQVLLLWLRAEDP